MSATARARRPHRHHNPTGAGSLHHSGNMWTMLHRMRYRDAQTYPFLFCLKCDVGAHCERVELHADIADIGCTHLLGDVAVKVIEHEPDVRLTYQFRPAVWTVCFPPATPFAVAS
jgi:hypothetical protein